MKLYESGEDYLEAVLMLQKKNGMVRSVDLARHMEVSKPSVCHAVATLRDGGFLMIPRMHQGLVANGWALNTEYFAEVLHLLRDDLTYTTIVDECLAVPAKPDKRDLTAIKRLCTAFVKLLYPNATCKDDIPADEFIKYCLEPAKEMRGVIKKQLCIIDPKEFNVPGKKDIPDIQYNYM